MSLEDNNQHTFGDLKNIMVFIEEGSIVPVISNSFRIEELFRSDKELLEKLGDTPEFYDEIRTIDQQLTKQWAKKIGYPMSDDHNLARVAQFLQVESDFDPEQAKIAYLKFLNDRLLNLCENEPEYKDKVREYKKQTQRLIFSKTVRDLDYPRQLSNDSEDPLRLLARLPLKIYITTSYSSFLEDALELEGKSPRTQLCFLSGGKASVKREHLPDPDYEPTIASPAVYHFFGLENYTDTLVISEDDHMNFLMNAVEEIKYQDLYPSPLRLALPEARLVLLGYNLRDWDFRTLFRFILRIRRTVRAKPSIAIQLKPSLGKKDYEERSLQYLERFFGEHNFKIRWTDAESFIHELSDTWDKHRKGLL